MREIRFPTHHPQLRLLLIMVGNVFDNCSASTKQFIAERNGLGLAQLLPVRFTLTAAPFTRALIIATTTLERGRLG
ncbi:hypothetical protein [Deinococcus hopiensis]|uniref:Uncharacterized protein n=1 Tax=Deinococcus hopiensis KR-140 TaxID=695939 RepID=A0A1W1UBN0_9DEIO|nr:hypothetical protein [Deinococcus hopiensis]SMB78505.1 hypothetical protein SAMN00790413_06685 [Deinococcus hopiensis KR-140]